MRFFDMLLNERGMVGTPDKDDDKDKDNDKDVIVEDPALDDEDVKADPDEESVEVDLDTDDEKKNKAEHNAKMAQQRLDQEKAALKRENEALRQTVEALQKTPPASQQYNVNPNDYVNWTDKQWDELAKTDWKKAVDLRAEIKAKQQYQEQSQSADFNKVLEESKNIVLRRHPELSDPTSEKAKLFRNIVTASPEYTTMKKGPIHAMREMEEYMEQNLGYKRDDIVKAENKARQSEQERLNRVQITSTAGRNVSTGNKITLTKDEVEFCTLQGIDPKVYAVNKKKLEQRGDKGGIQI